MNPEQYKLFTQMQAQIQELLEWKDEKQNQQITMPLDQSSKEILNEDALVYKATASGSPTPAGTVTVEINGIDVDLIKA